MPGSGRNVSHNTSHDQDILRLHEDGKGRNDIVRELGLTNGFVTRAAQRLGLKFDGSQVLMATETRRREAAERRAVLTISLLDDVERLRRRMFAPIKMISYGGKDYIRVEDTLDQPLPQDQAALARSVGMLLDRAVKLDEYDQRGTTLEDAFAFLDGVQVVIHGEVVPMKELEEKLDASDD